MVRSHYLPLSSSPDDPDLKVSKTPGSSPQDYVFTVAYLVVLLSVVASLFLTVTIWVFSPYKTNQSLPHPRSPTTYSNLHSVNLTHASPFSTIYSYAYVALQIHTADESRQTTEDDRAYQSRNGIIYPDDRHIVMNSRTSTVIQFRHLDYGMENCVLHVIVPEAFMKHDPKTQLHQPSGVDVWHLAMDSEISRYTPNSWYNAPKRKEVFTSFELRKVGEELRSEEFHCSSGGYSTFELTCHDGHDGCLVDFWQVKDEPHNGFYVSQADSL